MGITRLFHANDLEINLKEDRVSGGERVVGNGYTEAKNLSSRSQSPVTRPECFGSWPSPDEIGD